MRGVFVVALGGIFYHVLHWIDPRVLFHGDMVVLTDRFLLFPRFSCTWAFFVPFLSRPGGAAEWAGAGGSQFLAYPFVGAVIYTAVAAAICLATARAIGQLTGRPACLTALAPVLLLIMIWNYYVFPLSDHLGLICVLLTFNGYLRLQHPWARACCSVTGLIVLYHLLGAPAILLSALCGLLELTHPRRNRLLGLAQLTVGALVPYILGVRLLGTTPAEAYLGEIAFNGRVRGFAIGVPPRMAIAAWAGLYCFYVAGVLVMAARSWLARTSARPVQWLRTLADRWRNDLMLRVVASAAILLLGAKVAHDTYQGDVGTVLRVHAGTVQGNWPEALRHARLPGGSGTRQASRYVNRALFETGRLGDRMFSFPQRLDALLAHPRQVRQSPAEAEILLALGAVTHAEHMGCELLEAWGPRPAILRLLARVFIAKRQPGAARFFLSVLSRDIVQGPWARRQLGLLADDPQMSSDQEMRRIRSVMFTQDVLQQRSELQMLTALCDANGDNPMAFEYLVAQAMLLRRPDVAAQVLSAGRKYLGRTVPDHFAEALVAYTTRTGKVVDIGDAVVSPELLRRTARCFELMGDPDAAAMEAALASQYPNSFLRYLVTRPSGRDR